ncbi:MAG: class I SAM-dependent methyltransferase [Armatimonadetes bacterium]|nr:class I SAM-dependent methyltransferase [Armatimonadota bacterium]
MRILYGPTDPRNQTDGFILQAIRRDHRIATFGEEQADIIYTYAKGSFTEILGRLVSGQEPEIVLFCEPEERAIPTGLEKCPFMLGAVVCDWRSRFSVLREIAGYFDFLILPEEGMEALKRAGDTPLLLSKGIPEPPAIHEAALLDCLQEVYIRLQGAFQPARRIICASSEAERRRIRASQALAVPDPARFLAAEKELRAAQAVAPHHALLQNNLGVLYAAYAAASSESQRRERFFDEAVRQLEAARNRDSGYGTAEANRARVLVEMSLFGEAAQSLRRAIRLLRQGTPEPFSESLYFPPDDPGFRQAFEEAAVRFADQPEAFDSQVRSLLIQRLEALDNAMTAHQAAPPGISPVTGERPVVEGMREINFLYRPAVSWEESDWQAVLRVYTGLFTAREPVALMIDPHRGGSYSEEKLASIAGDIQTFLIESGLSPLEVADILLPDEETARAFAQQIEAGCRARVSVRREQAVSDSPLPLLQHDSEEELARLWRRFFLEISSLDQQRSPRRKYALAPLSGYNEFLSLDADAFSRCRKVLDVRCGAGAFLATLAKRNIIAEGIEADPEIAAFCRSRRFQVFDSLQAASGPYDGIYAAYILERMPGEEAVRCLEECARLLAPGGILLVRTVKYDARDESFWLDYSHVRPYPFPLLNRIFEDLGLVIVFSAAGDGDSRIIGRKS